MGHNDFNIDKQSNLKKAASLRESNFILVGDNIVTIRSCMTNDHPPYTLHPILQTASAYLARGNRYYTMYSCQNCQHTTLLVYPPPTLSTHSSCKHGITKSGSTTLVTWPAWNQQFPKDVGPWVLSLGTPWTHTSLQQSCSRLEQITPDVQCLNSE